MPCVARGRTRASALGRGVLTRFLGIIYMSIKPIVVLCALVSTMIPSFTILAAQESKSAAIQLPKPQVRGGKPLMDALMARKSIREFRNEPLSAQMLSDLLWAASGINRPHDGRRTAPTARNKREIDVYVVSASGASLYDHKEHKLVPLTAKDISADTGTQSYVRDAALNLVYVADFARMEGYENSQKVFLSAADTGFVCQNVYLYCASVGLGTVARASINREKLATLLKLSPTQVITLAQTVGHPRASDGSGK